MSSKKARRTRSSAPPHRVTIVQDECREDLVHWIAVDRGDRLVYRVGDDFVDFLQARYGY